MQLIRGLHNLRPRHRDRVASIGNFDGVHLGHQVVLRQLHERARTHGVRGLVITFEPHPREYFDAAAAPGRMTTLREKLALLREHDVQDVLCLRFDRELAAMTAQAFVQTILVEGLGLKHLVVGDDFRFGHERQGDFHLLEALGGRAGFSVEHMHTYFLDGERVSSTRVRRALGLGRLNEAERLLGRRYSMSGRVTRGQRRGREWGYPTANVPLHRRRPPLSGIFAVEVIGLSDVPLPGVASIGTRPTVDGKHTVLEVHLLDFDRDIYGRRIEVRFLKKQRDEEKFATVDDLVAQIAADKREAESFFAARG